MQLRAPLPFGGRQFVLDLSAISRIVHDLDDRKLLTVRTTRDLRAARQPGHAVDGTLSDSGAGGNRSSRDPAAAESRIAASDGHMNHSHGRAVNGPS